MDQWCLPFLPTTRTHKKRVKDSDQALFDDYSKEWVTYGTLRNQIETHAQYFMKSERGVVLHSFQQTIKSVITYLAAIHSGHAVILIDPDAPNLKELEKEYQPEWTVHPCGKTVKNQTTTSAIHPDFFLLLLTSGSTGSSKGVRLSYNNISHNTDAIIKSVNLSPQQTALGLLPLSYSFGLSILHTQLAVGGRMVLSKKSMMSKDLWDISRSQKVTLFAGVPYHYEMLMRLGLKRLNCPSLHCFLQAGGAMQKKPTQLLLNEVMKIKDGELHIMYGQTETSPRISSFALHNHPEKIGSVGTPLYEGNLTLEDGELIYHGPNVMMGYAQTRLDLSKDDEMHGTIKTGDLADLDQDGFITITGRKKRFAKLFGQRIELDHIEKIASEISLCAAISSNDKIIIVTQDNNAEKIKHKIVEQTNLPAPWFDIQVVKNLPKKNNGKIDYSIINKIAGGMNA